MKCKIPVFRKGRGLKLALQHTIKMMKKSDRKHIVFLNPSSGRSRALRNREKLVRLLDESGLPYELHVSQSEEDLRLLIRKNGPRALSLVAAGGDSTFTILVNEVMGKSMAKKLKNIPLGVIPLGSSDDIALEYGIKNIYDAVRAMKAGVTRKADLGLIRASGGYTHYFPGQANMGIGASVNRFVAAAGGNQTLTGILGIYMSFKNRQVPQDFTISFDQEKIQANFISLLFSKIKYWAGGRIFLPDARPDDGKIHLLTIEGRGLGVFREFFDMLKIMLKAGKGQHTKYGFINLYKSEKYSISSSRDFIIQVDGDILQEGPGKNKDREFRKVQINVLKKQIDIFYNGSL